MEENTFETINLTTSDDNDVSLKECVLNIAATPVLLATTNVNNTAKYLTCSENGEIVLNKIGDSVLNVNLSKSNEIQTIAKKESNPTKQNQTHIRKKLCYEKPHNIQPLSIQLKPDASVFLKLPRKQIIDQRTMISPREFKRQLIYTADTITQSKLAPCTRQQLMHVLNGITTLFAHPAHKMPNSNLMQLYVSKCSCKKEPNMASTDDMNLLPLIENKGTTKTSLKQNYGKRKNTAGISNNFPKVQIIENVKKETENDSDINLSSIKKIYHIRKCNTQDLTTDNEIIDHEYSKQIIKVEEIEENSTCDSMYTITLDIDNIKEESISENQIVILSMDSDGELTENNINVLLDAANIKTSLANKSDKEIVTFTDNIDSENYDNNLSNIVIVQSNDENNDNEHIIKVENT